MGRQSGGSKTSKTEPSKKNKNASISPSRKKKNAKVPIQSARVLKTDSTSSSSSRFIYGSFLSVVLVLSALSIMIASSLDLEVRGFSTASEHGGFFVHGSY